MQVEVEKKTGGTKILQLIPFTCNGQLYYQKNKKNMVDELYAYFLKAAPSLFFLSISFTSHVSLRVTFFWKIKKIIEKTVLEDCLIVKRSSIHIWLHATVGESRFGSEKTWSQLITIHMRNFSQQSETRRVTQKKPLKKPLYFRYSCPWRSRSTKKGKITSISDGLHG